jgi:general nucleoside transport system permease protein
MEKEKPMKAESTAGLVPLSHKKKWLNTLGVLQGPVLAILGALIVGSIVITVTGRNPINAYWAMFKGAFAGKGFVNLASTLNRSVPIIGMGLAAAVAFRAGFFNIGGEGQMVLGGFSAALVAIYLPLSSPVILPVALLSAAVIGGLYALLAMVIEHNFNVPLLISTLLLNYPARLLTSYFVKNQFRDVASGLSQTLLVPKAARFALLTTGSQLNTGLFVILFLIIASALVIYRTVPGYDLRMIGLNRRFAIYGGVGVKKMDYGVMFVSGAVAGIVGAVMVLGVFYRYIDTALITPSYAWVGLMAALLSGADPLGVVFAGLVFSAITTGGYGMEKDTDIPREMSLFLQALIIMFIAIRGRFRIKRKTR